MIRTRTQSALSRLRQFATHLACALVALATLAPTAFAQDVWIVVSGDAQPYRQAANAAASELRNANRKSEILDVSQWEERTSDRPEVVIVIGAEAAAATRTSADDSLRLVYAMITDPQRAGLTESAHIEGVSATASMPEQIGLIARALPGASRIGVLYRSSSQASANGVEALRTGARGKWTIEAVDADAYPSVAAAIEALFAKNIDIVWTAPDAAVFDQAALRQLLLRSLRTGTPVFGFSLALVRAGALLGVTVEPEDQGQQAARLADRRLHALAGTGRSTDVDTIHISARLRYAVNLIVSERLRKKLEAHTVARADFVFEE